MTDFDVCAGDAAATMSAAWAVLSAEVDSVQAAHSIISSMQTPRATAAAGISSPPRSAVPSQREVSTALLESTMMELIKQTGPALRKVLN